MTATRRSVSVPLTVGVAVVALLAGVGIGTSTTDNPTADPARYGLVAPGFDPARVSAKLAEIEKTAREAQALLNAPTAPAEETTTTPAKVCAINPANGQAAITKAIAGCPDGSVVRFPKNKTYRQTSRIDVWDRHNLTIDGNGSTFITNAGASAQGNVASGPNGNWVILRGSNITIRNMTAVGAFDVGGPGGKRDMVAANAHPEVIESNSAFAIYGTDGALVEDVTTRNVWGDGFTTGTDIYVDPAVPAANASYTRNLTIQRVTVEKVFRMCFGPTMGVNITIQDSVCRDAWYGGLDAELDNVDQPLANHRYLRNTFDGFLHFGILVPIAGEGTKGIEIAGNRFLTGADNFCAATIGVGIYPDSNPRTFADVRVEANEITAVARAVVLDHVNGGTVKANTIRRIPTPSGDPVEAWCGTTEPITVTNSAGVTVEGNR